MPTSVLPADQAQRDRALDITRSFIVQAPAGSGKTELLSQRYLKLLAEVDEPEEVLAITFTKKAAGEMRDRVLKAVREASEDTFPIDGAKAHKKLTRQLARNVLTRSRERGWRLLETPSRLRIQTIDSFCYSIVQQSPVQANFGASAGIAEDGADRRQIFLDAAYNTIKLLGSVQDANGAVRRVLEHRDNNVGQVAGLISAMLARRDQWERHVAGQRDPGELRRELEAVLERIVCEALERLREKIPPEHEAELVRWMGYAAANLNGNGKANPYTACLDLKGLPACTAEDLEKWVTVRKLLVKQDGDWRKKVDVNNGFPSERKLEKTQFTNLLGDLASLPDGELLDAFCALDDLPAPHFDEAQWQVLEALLSMLPIAVEELRKVFQTRSVVDFIEMSQGALRALEQARASGDTSTARIRHLLVDEFQDTSVSQARLLDQLTRGWTEGDGRTLFLVGDPMQSIYRFRQAEVGLFLQAKQGGLGRVRLEQLPLNVNFRSDESLVAWFNEQFAPIFGDEDRASEGVVSFNRAAARPMAQEGVKPFCHRAADNDDEAIQVAGIAKEALGAGEEVAIIVRARTHLPKIIAALRGEGLRFQAVDIDNLAERQGVLDVLMLTRALLNAGDRLAWLAVLRAPWCGLTLADLHALCGQDHKSAMWDLIAANFDSLSDCGRPSLCRFREVVAAALARRGRVRLREWVEGVWIALGGPACVENATDLEDIETYFELLEGLQGSSELSDPAYLAERVKNLFARPDAAEDCKLKILTIHKAKGLEFDTVILPGLGRKPQNDDSPLLLWEERAGDDGTELLLAPISEKGAAETDPIYKFLRKAESARRREEDKRLLYVAVTRAKHRLHLVAVPRMNKDQTDLRQDGALLQYLWPGVSDEFVPRNLFDMAAQGEDEEDKEEESVAPHYPMRLRRLPADWRLPALLEAVDCASNELEVSAPGDPVSYDWVGEKLRQIGIVVHAMLQRIAREGLSSWHEKRIAESRALFQTALAGRGIAGDDLDETVAQVERALLQIVGDERGRWTLAEHSQAESEYGLTGVLDGRIRRCKFDRTFVDEQGTRWIIDYKTSTHEGAGLEGFLDREQERYREQLEEYARLMRLQYPDEGIRLGLYFPLLKAWREWTPE